MPWPNFAAYSKPFTTRKSVPSAAVMNTMSSHLPRLPFEIALTASTIVSDETIRTAVLNAASGQAISFCAASASWGFAIRSTTYAPMNPAKNMISDARKSHIPNRARSNFSTCSSEPWWETAAAWSMVSGSLRGQRHQTEQAGQISEGREEQPARPLPRPLPREREAERQERGAEGARAREIRPARPAHRHGREADEDQGQGLQDDLPRRAPALGIDDRQHRISRLRVVLAVQPRDREEVRQLPEEQDAEERPRAGVERAPRRRPSHHGGQRAGDRADHGAERRPRLQRGVDEDVEDEGRRRQHGGQGVHLHREEHDAGRREDAAVRDRGS